MKPERTDIALIIVDGDGRESPGWALRAGQTIERTDYDHGERRITVRLSNRVPLCPTCKGPLIGRTPDRRFGENHLVQECLNGHVWTLHAE